MGKNTPRYLYIITDDQFHHGTSLQSESGVLFVCYCCTLRMVPIFRLSINSIACPGTIGLSTVSIAIHTGLFKHVSCSNSQCVSLIELLRMEVDVSLSASIDSSPGPRPKTNPSTDHFQFSFALLEVPDGVWGAG